jgi:predicted ArsR family transcriptional regulator
LTGRTGPGSGRPSKLYRVVTTDRHEVSVPPTNPTLVARLLLEAVRRGGPRGAAEALLHAAREAGQAMAQAVGTGGGLRHRRDRFVSVLAAYGYTPGAADGELFLSNCPYQPLVEADRDLVCGTNVALIAALADGLGLGGDRCVLRPDALRCCVRVTPWPEGSRVDRDG